MEYNRRRKIAAVLLAVVALASVALANYASALNAQGSLTESAIWAKVYGYGDWIELDGTYQTLISITLPHIPVSACYHVVCDGYISLEASAQTQIALGVDSPAEDMSTRRYYKTDGHISTEFTLTGVHTERVYLLSSGVHTFYFLGKAAGTSRANYHTITVTLYTYGYLTELATTPETSIAPDGLPSSN